MYRHLASVMAGFFTAVLLSGAALADGVMKPDGEAAYTNVVDVSHYTAVTSWAALRQHTSILYAKATEGTSYIDPTLDSWACGAQENGLDFGFFHYFWPGGLQSAVDQADAFVRVIGQYPYTCLPAVDVEEDNGCPRAEITAEVEAFRAEVKRLTGYDCMVYVSAGRIDRYFTALPAAPLWIADYGSPSAEGPRALSEAVAGRLWTVWQYTASASWPGLAGGVDADRATASVLLSGHAADSPAPASDVPHGDPAVLVLQQRLNRLSIPRPALAEDGVSGPKTHGAVQTLERVAGIDVDSGIYGSQCRAAVSRIDARPTLWFGSRGQVVRYLQYRLGIAVDGVFGPQTRAAVTAWQRAHGLAADGVAGPATWASLLG